MSNKYLVDFFVRVSKLFGIPLVRFEDNSLRLVHLGEKVDVFETESQIIKEQIRNCNQHMDYLKANFIEDDYSQILSREKYLELKRKKLNLQVEQYCKQEFVAQYKNRIKLEQEYYSEHTELVKRNMIAVKDCLEKSITFIPDGTKHKALAIGKLNRFYNDKLTTYQINTLYDEMVDLNSLLKFYENGQETS